jgi:hypothetical protein
MNLLERLRRFWLGGTGPDHALTAEEREQDRPATAEDERARIEEQVVGGDFDPDGSR